MKELNRLHQENSYDITISIKTDIALYAHLNANTLIVSTSIPSSVHFNRLKNFNIQQHLVNSFCRMKRFNG